MPSNIPSIIKHNPFGDAIIPKRKLWRKPKEGLLITTKGKKEGNNGRCAKFFLLPLHLEKLCVDIGIQIFILMVKITEIL